MTDRTALVADLKDSATRFAAAFRDLTPAQFHYKPAPDRWSVAETAEHVIVAETGSAKLLRGKLVREEATPEQVEAARDGLRRTEARLLNRDTPFPAPDFVMPAARWQTPAEMLAVFEETRNATIEFLATTPLDLTRYVAPHPALGPLNGEGWAQFLVLHCLRHLDQIVAVKASPGYPA